MQLRFVFMLVLSGVVHAGALIVGSGIYRDFFTAFEDTRQATATLTVSISPDSGDNPAGTVAQEVDSPDDTEHPEPGERIGAPEPEQSPGGAARRAAQPPGASPATGPETEARASAPETSARSNATQTARSDPAAPRRAMQPGGPAPPAAATRNASAAPSSTPAGRREKAEREYLTEFLTELSKYKHYPHSAQSRQQQGKVIVGLMLKSDGTIHDVQIEKRSAFPALDRAALRSVRRLERFKPFPAHVERSTWRLSVPFQYALSDR